MSEAELKRLLGWIYHRSRVGLFQGRAARDAALSDINHATQKFGQYWDGQATKRDPNHEWMGEQP